MPEVRCRKCKESLNYSEYMAGKVMLCAFCGNKVTCPPLAPPPGSRDAAGEDQDEAEELESAGDPDPNYPELGPLVKVYSALPWFLGVPLFLVPGLVGLGLTVYGVIAADPLPFMLGVTGFVCFSAPFLLVFAYLTPGSLRRVRVYRKGFIYRGLTKKVAVPWDEIKGWRILRIHLKKRIIGFHFELQDGTEFHLRFWPMRGAEQFANLAHQATRFLLQKRISALLQAGKTVPFGEEVVLSTTGLMYCPGGSKKKADALGWRQIGSVVDGGVGRPARNAAPATAGALGALGDRQNAAMGLLVIVDGKVRWAINWSDIANYAVLLDLLKKRFGVVVRAPE
jgi:hypothetical protein